jgi:stromal membrane-associated protein
MSSSAAEKEQALLKKRLEAQLKLPHNLTCADCPSRRASPRFSLRPVRRLSRSPCAVPRWASTNLGVFICTNCSVRPSASAARAAAAAGR